MIIWFEISILFLLLILSFFLIRQNFYLSIFVLLILSVLLHKEFFSIYKWDLLPVRIFMIALVINGGYVLLKSALKSGFFPKILEYLKQPFISLLLILWLIRGFSIMFSKNLSASIFLFGFFTTVVVLGIYFYLKLKDAPDRVYKYLMFYICVLFGVCLFGYLQVAIYLIFDYVIGSLWVVPGHVPRVGSTFWDVNHFAGLLASILPVIGVLILTSSGLKKKLMYFFMFIPMLGILVLTNSRTAWIVAFVAFVAFITTLLVKRFGLRGILYVFLTILLLTIPLVKEYQIKSSPFRAKVKQYFHYRIDSFDSHFMLLRGALEVFEKYPILGGGYGSFYEHFSKTDVAAEFFGRDPAALNVRVPAHTIWGEAISETGILGLSTLILLFLLIYSTVLYVSFTINDKRQFLLTNAMASALLGWFIAGIFYSYKAEFFWLILFLYFVYAVGLLRERYNIAQIIRYFFFNKKFPVFILSFLGLFLMFFQLGKNHLIPWDEAIYAKVSKNMIISGDYLTQIWRSTIPWYEKPPFYMWLMSISMKLVGINSWGARIPSAIFGIATVLLIYFLGKKFFNKTVGFISAFTLATTFQFLYYSRTSMLDVTTTFFITLSLFFYFSSRFKEDRLIYWILSGISLGVAVMTKGVIGLIGFPVIFLNEIVYLFGNKFKFSRHLIKRYFFLIFSSLLIFLPWHLYMYKRFGIEFVNNYLIYHVLERATEAIEDKGRPFFWYIIVMRVSMRLWFISLLFALPYITYLAIFKKSRFSLGILLWALFVFLFFSSATSKLVWYIVPLYPVCALINGKFIGDIFGWLIEKIPCVEKNVYRFLGIYALCIFGLTYLYLNRELVYHSDLTGPQATLLQKKDELFGVTEKVYADRIDLPLVLFYSEGPYEVVDFGPLRDKITFAAYNEHVIFITKESRFRAFSEIRSDISLEDFYKEWVLGYMPSFYEKDKEILNELSESAEKLQSEITYLEQSNKFVPSNLYAELNYLQGEMEKLEQEISRKLASI